jgi:hypothetical protein
MDIKENFKRGFKDKVDLLMFLIIIGISIADLGFDYNIKGGYAFLAVYVSSFIYRIGFFKNALNRYVTRVDFRDRLGLPNSKK